MDNKNPVFARMDQQTAGGSGFAYTEGLSAYKQAGQQPYPAQAQPGAPVTPQGPPTGSVYEPITDRMTLDDVIVRTGITIAVLIPFALVGWFTAPTMPFLYFIAMFVGLGLGIANAVKKTVSPPLILAYAAAQGVFLGGISYAFDRWALGSGYEGLVSQAIIGTLVAFVVMLALYKSRIVKVDGRFMKIMMVAMVSYLVIALMSFVSALFGVGGGFGFYGVGTLGIILCMIGVALASFSLLIDFESIHRGIQAGLPSQESWRMAFGLLVTLVWLYIEILRLLAIVAASRD
jgi:uncharacterized YccA/Bax inhibitor family protein